MDSETDRELGRERDRPPPLSVRRLLPLGFVLAAIIAFFALGLGRYLTFEALAQNRGWLLQEVARLGAFAALLFIALYVLVAALSLPGAAILSLASGFFFGTWLGGLYSLIGATIGASLIFLIARTSLGEPLRRRAGPFLRRVEAGFRRDAASYLLVLRLVPIAPFWLVNLVPAFFGVPLRVFVVASFFGMAPAAFIYASVGAGLGAILEAGGTPDLHIVFQWRILAPLIALSALACMPIGYKWYRRRQGAVP